MADPDPRPWLRELAHENLESARHYLDMTQAALRAGDDALTTLALADFVAFVKTAVQARNEVAKINRQEATNTMVAA